MQSNEPQASPSGNPIRVLGSDPHAARAATLKALHAGIARAEQNLASLVHGTRPDRPLPRRRPPPFILTEGLAITEEPSALRAALDQSGPLPSPPSEASVEWSYSGDSADAVPSE